MSTNAELEVKLRQHLSEARDNGATNEDLIREAINQIFFCLGENPSNARVLDVVRAPGKSPSATTVQRAINEFWRDVRSRISLTLSAPTLPDEVRQAFEAAAVKSWDAALIAANQALDSDRREMATEMADLRHKTEVDLASLGSQLAARDESIASLNAIITGLNTEIESERARCAAAAEGLAASNSMLEELRKNYEALEGKLQAAELALKEAGIAHQAKIDQLNEQHLAKITQLSEMHGLERDRLTQDNAKLSQLLTSSDNKIMELKLTIQREIDRSEGVAKTLKELEQSSQTAAFTAARDIRQLRERAERADLDAAEAKGQLQNCESQVASLTAQLDEANRALGEMRALDKLSDKPSAYEILRENGTELVKAEFLERHATDELRALPKVALFPRKYEVKDGH